MKYTGTYFDYDHRRFKKNIKFFSTPKGCSVFLSLQGIEPSELWTHARKVHVFFGKRNFMDETRSFYSAYLQYLRMLEENDIANPDRCFYLHFLEHAEKGIDPSEIAAFVNYLGSSTQAYLDWRKFLHQETTKIRTLSPADMIYYVYQPYRSIKFDMSGGCKYNPVYFEVEPDYRRGIFDLAVVLHPNKYADPEKYYLSENLTEDLLFSKVNVGDPMGFTKEQVFALSMIKNYCDSVFSERLGLAKDAEIDLNTLYEFCTKTGKFENLPEEKTRNLQDAFSHSYEIFLSLFDSFITKSSGGNEG